MGDAARMDGDGVTTHEPSDFQLAATGAFLRIMRVRRPDVVWSAREPDEVRDVVSEPDDPNTLPDGTTRAAA
jgi:hypothetical protein